MTSNEFPYIKSIHVNDCFAYQNFDIDLPPLNGKPFSHLILTGKNGSGKTTILRGLEQNIGFLLLGQEGGYEMTSNLELYVKSANKRKEETPWENILFLRKNISPTFNKKNEKEIFDIIGGKSIFSFFLANRLVKPVDVNSPTKENDFIKQLLGKDSTVYFIQQFKQFLVNKKVELAFEQIGKNDIGIKKVEQFFDVFTTILKRFFEDESLELIFEQRQFEFYISLKDDRKITFNQMSEGFSAFISILVDLLIRVDLIRSTVNDYTYDPCGIVLLDEPETHLHIKAQYEVLPILTEFFPNVQFIVATHSPAVISSIKNTTIFDLTSQQSVTDEVVGRSYSELMVTHFGLDNEFSPIADAIIDNVEKAVKETKTNKPLLKLKLQEILSGNERYLSPTLRLELESLILENS
jgi:predicted ATP-binding protein involved in virulence